MKPHRYYRPPTVAQCLVRGMFAALIPAILGGVAAVWWCFDGITGCDGGTCAVCVVYAPIGGAVGYGLGVLVIPAALYFRGKRREDKLAARSNDA